MPIHDWTRVDAGIFHHFHHDWITEIKRAMNRQLQGTDYYALAEQISGSREPIGQSLSSAAVATEGSNSAIPSVKNRSSTLKQAPPKATFRITNPPKWFANKKKSVTIRHVSEHRIVAVLEIVSPGNKDSRSALNAFVRKTQDLLSAGVHLSLVDLFPPTPRDPQGIHMEVWGEDDADTYQFNPAKPLTCASYTGGLGPQALVEPVAVGDELPDLPIFLTFEEHILTPLESTYKAAFDGVPEFWRDELIRLTAK